MRCKGCKKTSSVQKSKHYFSWEQYGMCGICARKYHPEYYNAKAQLTKIKNQRTAQERRVLKKESELEKEKIKLLKLEREIAHFDVKIEIKKLHIAEQILVQNLDQTTRKKELLLKQLSMRSLN